MLQSVKSVIIRSLYVTTVALAALTLINLSLDLTYF